jgi:hypothetical protein
VRQVEAGGRLGRVRGPPPLGEQRKQPRPRRLSEDVVGVDDPGGSDDLLFIAAS